MAFDIIGDVHGCYHTFIKLVASLGYLEQDGILRHPEERQLVFLGDLTDRGPESVKMIEHVAKLVKAGAALYVPGNHCNKLYRYMIGRNVQIKHGLETTVAELKALDNQKRDAVVAMFTALYDAAPIYLTLDDGKLVVAHAGIKEQDIGQESKRIESFVLYGDTTGQFEAGGMPVRRDWAKGYRGDPWIVYGHTPVLEPRKMNHTFNIDTGCVFGGSLTALRYPEMTTTSVPSDLPFVKEKFSRFE